MSYSGTSSIPPQIRHSCVPNCTIDQRGEIAQAAAKNIRLSDRAMRLLVYYATAGEGFRPALKTIEQATGIPCNKISEIRKELIDHNAIIYSLAAKVIWVHWMALKAFAMIEPMKKADAKNSNNYPRMQESRDREYIRAPNGTDDWLRGYVRFINSTTPEEYKAVVACIQSQKRGT